MARNENNAKLTREQVAKVRELAKEGFKRADLAKRFSISLGAVGKILRGESWPT